jgi:hypothetical protein
LISSSMCSTRSMNEQIRSPGILDLTRVMAASNKRHPANAPRIGR